MCSTKPGLVSRRHRALKSNSMLLTKQVNIISAAFFLVVAIGISPTVFAQRRASKKPVERKAEQKIILADNGFSRYSIVLPSHATPYEQKAATVLQNYILQISGAALPVITADKHKSSYEIILGQNERFDELSSGINYKLLQEDGFLIKSDSSRLMIAGGNEKGTLYGVYTFLEKYLGCRMYSPKVKIIPQQKQIIIGKINDLEVPVI